MRERHKLNDIICILVIMLQSTEMTNNITAIIYLKDDIFQKFMILHKYQNSILTYKTQIHVIAKNTKM